jgi:hypothetical protein
MFNYEDWFKSNNILENMCKIIPYINYEEKKTDSKENDDNSSNSSSSFRTSINFNFTKNCICRLFQNYFISRLDMNNCLKIYKIYSIQLF